jgi:hypothetical protein
VTSIPKDYNTSVQSFHSLIFYSSNISLIARWIRLGSRVGTVVKGWSEETVMSLGRFGKVKPLVVNAKQRLSSSFLLSCLQKMVETAENDETYLLQPYMKWETGQSLAIISCDIEDVKVVENDGMNIL